MIDSRQWNVELLPSNTPRHSTSDQTLIQCAHGTLSSRLKRQGIQADHSLPCSAEAKMSECLPQFRHKPSRDAE